MAWQIWGYSLYLGLTLLITFGVGLHLYHQGIWYLRDAFQQQEAMAQSFNRFLLAGYYLLNLGYATLSLSFWVQVSSFASMLHQLVFRVGLILLLLGIIHYGNLFVFRHFSGKLRQLYQQLNF